MPARSVIDHTPGLSLGQALASKKRFIFAVLTCAALLWPAVAPAGASASSNLLKNPSLENASGSTPTCWLLGGYGTNAFRWTRTADAHTGGFAENLTVTSWTSGDRKLASALDSGTCAPAATPGHTYTASAWYKVPSGYTAHPEFWAYYRSGSGAWTYWAHSPQFASSASWAQVSWTTPAVPLGATNLSISMGIINTGSVTMDDFGLVDASASAVAPLAPTNPTPTAGDQQVALSWTASTESGGTVAGYRVYRNGTQIAQIMGTNYTDSGLTDGTTYSYYVRAYDTAGNLSPASSTVSAMPVDTTPPSVPSSVTASPGDGQVALSWSASTDNVGVAGYKVFRSGKLIGSTSSTSYSDTGLTDGTTYSYTVTAYDAAGNTSAQSTSVTSAPVGPVTSGGTYFGTLPSQAAGLPNSDTTCASLVTPAPEQRPGNTTANNTVPSNPSAVPWSNAELGTYWSKWIANRSLVTGNYTGTTDEILQWAACKWGIDENVIRAVAVQESTWYMSEVGDNCGVAGEASYGILQIKNAYCNGSSAWGGYPYTAHDTALNADFYAAYIRSCLDNDFYDGGSWLYGGQTIAQIIAAKGQNYALWGCVGSWYSGGWYDSGAQTYISSAQAHLAALPWTQPGF
jgi:chitodextrinase